jgi:hypothetical protein
VNTTRLSSLYIDLCILATFFFSGRDFTRRIVMGKGSRSAVKHQLFKDKARNRVDDLQEKFSDLQSARKQSRTAEVAVLEEQLHQMLREWKAELNQPSPACSLQVIQLISSYFS